MTQVLENNAKLNLDPGGFTVLLHFWTMISNNFIFLRLLPFILFIVGMILVSRLSLIWEVENLLVYFSGFVLLLSPLLCQYAFELRAYSMEMLTVILALYYCYKIPNILNNYRYSLFAGSLLAVLLTSRYSAVFSVISLGIIIFINLIKYHFNRKSVINFIIFLIPIIISGITIYFFTFQYQNPTGAPPNYVKSLVFKTTDIHHLLFDRLNLLLHVFYTMFPILVLILLYIFSFKKNSIKKIMKPYNLYLLYALILNLIFITLSLMGKYPWSVNSKWDMSTHTIFIIAWLPLIFIITNFLYKKYLLYEKLKIFIPLIFILYFFSIAIRYVIPSIDSTYTNYIHNNISSNSSILINVTASPTIRYLFEYGPLATEKNINNYKNISLFNNTNDMNLGSTTTLKKIDTYDYIILTQIDYDNSELKNILSKKPNWIDCATTGPSKMFKNTAKI
ncbi:MAG: hypothetical protein NTU76_01590 [Candidatus Taylorbacteria bacterium]|nr:hypothetical protein [Candidatus Taylorbacteria bacterium]